MIQVIQLYNRMHGVKQEDPLGGELFGVSKSDCLVQSVTRWQSVRTGGWGNTVGAGCQSCKLWHNSHTVLNEKLTDGATFSGRLSDTVHLASGSHCAIRYFSSQQTRRRRRRHDVTAAGPRKIFAHSRQQQQLQLQEEITS